MAKSRTINVSDKTWKRINKDKYSLNLRTHEEVILRLYKIISKTKTAKDLEEEK
jgi:hypothetical protein